MTIIQTPLISYSQAPHTNVSYGVSDCSRHVHQHWSTSRHLDAQKTYTQLIEFKECLCLYSHLCHQTFLAVVQNTENILVLKSARMHGVNCLLAILQLPILLAVLKDHTLCHGWDKMVSDKNLRQFQNIKNTDAKVLAFRQLYDPRRKSRTCHKC